MSQTDGDAARLLLLHIDSPLINEVLDPEGVIYWEQLYEVYPQLSSGEQALADFACSITGRQCFDRERTGFRSIHELAGRLDDRTRGLVGVAILNAMHAS